MRSIIKCSDKISMNHKYPCSLEQSEQVMIHIQISVYYVINFASYDTYYS